MGLDTTHGCWHGPYSAFHRWRMEVAKAAGIDLRELWAMTPESKESSLGRWVETPDNPLMVLLLHSDCDGVIQDDQCIPLANALNALKPKLPSGWRPTTEEFIIGLLRAADKGQDVEFH